ncbi:MAG: sigma-54-dependent Fis family transcriptional regulator [Chitinispirillaceae bacterium]|nr:sigma-54-dependent Fis family transcriptional regulator [Chitinispirillaceae bacterium]
MPLKNRSLLIVEDDEAAAFGYTEYLSQLGCSAITAHTLKDANRLLETAVFDALLLDLRLPDGNALHWIPEQKNSFPQIPIIVISGISDIPTAVQAMKNGAENFLTKPVEMDELTSVLEKCLELSLLRKKTTIQQRLSRVETPCFGVSEKITQLLEFVQLAAANDSVILLQGETGTGKGVLARWIHEKSRRAPEAFVELNCSGLKGELLKSELYGHAKGAFTSAIREREGLMEVADRGTLFLDEIGDMDSEVQAQLLKTIEEKSFRRIGENRVRKSDFRLICATNRDLLEEVTAGRFRSDLYYRICVFPVTVPPLRERIDDIPVLAAHFLAAGSYAGQPFDREVLQALQNYPWPGNVRELKNMLERATLLAQGGNLAISHFPGINGRCGTTGSRVTTDNLYEMEKQHIYSVLGKYNGDKKMASEALGMSFSNLYRRLLQYKKGSGAGTGDQSRKTVTV